MVGGSVIDPEQTVDTTEVIEPTVNPLSDVAGIWNASFTPQAANSGIDEMYVVLMEDGVAKIYDYQGDSLGNFDNCYTVHTGVIESDDDNHYAATFEFLESEFEELGPEKQTIDLSLLAAEQLSAVWGDDSFTIERELQFVEVDLTPICEEDETDPGTTTGGTTGTTTGGTTGTTTGGTTGTTTGGTTGTTTGGTTGTTTGSTTGTTTGGTTGTTTGGTTGTTTGVTTGTTTGGHTGMTTESTVEVVSNNTAYLMAMEDGSRIEIHAADAAKVSFTNLSQTATAGETQLRLQDSVNWEVGDRIAVSSTTQDLNEAEEFTITAISANGLLVTVDQPLQYQHRGETLSYNNALNGADYQEWDVEARAEVALLSRNVTIQGDAEAAEDGIGGHIMAHHGADLHVDGVELFHMGQQNVLGRYPIHWHLLGDHATGNYITNSSIHNTFNKGITIHGTSNVRAENNVIYETIGHSVFLEDAAETGNQILGNLVFGTREADSDTPLPTDFKDVSSFWVENPNNTFIGNIAGGSEEHGFWIFTEVEVHNQSVPLFSGINNDAANLIFEDNVIHSNDHFGIAIGRNLNDDLSIQTGGHGPSFGEMASIIDTTSYANHSGLWVLAQNFIVDGGVFVESQRDGLFMNGSYAENVLIANNNLGLRSYVDGDNAIVDSHFANNEFDIEVRMHHNHDSDVLSGLTFDDGVLDIKPFKGEQETAIVVTDLDGSSFGDGSTAAVVLREGPIQEFFAGPGATYNATYGGYLSTSPIGRTNVSKEGGSGNFDLVRSDGATLRNYDENDLDFLVSTGGAQDVAYLLDFNNLPTELELTLHDVEVGNSVIYQIANVGSFGGIIDSRKVDSLAELVSANRNSHFHADEQLYIRLVAGSNDIPTDLAHVDALLANEAIVIRNIVDGTTGNHGSRTLSADLLAAIDTQNLDTTNATLVDAPAARPGSDFVLQRFASTSNTVSVNSSTPRWSQASSWGNVGIPNASDIVVINPSEKVVLDKSTTVRGIIVNGGELIVEDRAGETIDLNADYVLVINGGLFQAGTETNPLDTDFTLTLEGDNPQSDLNVADILHGAVSNTIFANTGAGN